MNTQPLISVVYQLLMIFPKFHLGLFCQTRLATWLKHQCQDIWHRPGGQGCMCEASSSKYTQTWPFQLLHFTLSLVICTCLQVWYRAHDPQNTVAGAVKYFSVVNLLVNRLGKWEALEVTFNPFLEGICLSKGYIRHIWCSPSRKKTMIGHMPTSFNAVSTFVLDPFSSQ